MTLTPATQKLILHWGEMGTRWGINRTVAQIHALLYLAPDPLDAEEIAETLAVARSNVSNSLRELQGWGVIRRVHVLGDRKDHFESLKDVWEMFAIILDERKQREIDPTLEMLRECADLAARGGKEEAYAAERIGAMRDFFESMTTWYSQMRRLPAGAIAKLFRMGDKMRRMLGGK
ncbi:MAG TPA: MarR family transcriptional regulator [Phycisphaerae bacterium]|nr:MarR family transcriptional regulator [Phycisphaerales bacterium]HRX87572.1 MarR family transcriptional regulator [Phycisphaerae bacterium]